MKTYFFAINLLLFSLPILAQQEVEPHPIDVLRQQCHDVEENQTTYGMIACEAAALEAWTKEMDKYYELLIGKLGLESRQKFEQSQKRWLEFQALELDFSAKFYTDLEGSMWRIVAVGQACELVKARALALKSYYEVIDFE